MYILKSNLYKIHDLHKYYAYQIISITYHKIIFFFLSFDKDLVTDFFIVKVQR